MKGPFILHFGDANRTTVRGRESSIHVWLVYHHPYKLEFEPSNLSSIVCISSLLHVLTPTCWYRTVLAGLLRPSLLPVLWLGEREAALLYSGSVIACVFCTVPVENQEVRTFTLLHGIF